MRRKLIGCKCRAHIAEKMVMDSHMEDSEEGYKMNEKGAQTIHRKQISQGEIDKEINEIREEFDVLVMLLEENQRQGWVLKRKPVKWPKLHRRLQQEQVKWLIENLKEAKAKMEVSICRPK